MARGFAARVIRSNRSVDTHEILKKQINTISSDEKTEYNMDCGPVYPTDNKTRYSRTNYQRENQNIKQNNNTNNDMARIISMLETLTTQPPIERPMRLENKALPFNSVLHKYPNIAKQKIQTMYLLLDSKYRNLSTDDSTFKWTLTKSQNTTQGSVNSLADQIHNVISIQFEEFHIPTYTDTNNYEKASLFIEEFRSTSVLLNNGRYHMLFDVVQDGTLRKALIPAIYNDGEFKFYTPINNLNTITITFRSPFYPMTFSPDRVIVTGITKGATTTFTTGYTIELNDYVYITDFKTLATVAVDAGEAALEAVKNAVAAKTIANAASLMTTAKNLVTVFKTATGATDSDLSSTESGVALTDATTAETKANDAVNTANNQLTTATSPSDKPSTATMNDINLALTTLNTAITSAKAVVNTSKINEITRDEGHQITANTANTFTIAVDTVSVSDLISSYIAGSATVFIQSRRIFIPMRLEYIVE